MAFLETWAQAALTSIGFFWTALWAFAVGYFISSMIQVFVTRQRMRQAMGERGPKSVALGTVFGFISSSCSFAALATTRSLFAKGAGLVPSLAFLLASTNLVIELGVVIAIFLGWQFVVGEYAGGLLLILFMWLLVRLTKPGRLVKKVQERLEAEADEKDPAPLEEAIKQPAKWRDVAGTYVGEWHMVWKDVTIGFTVAGIISAFVPSAFFETLFVGAGSDDPAFWQVLLQALVGPLAAFFTFIGSMGNIPLAAVLFQNGVTMAGVMAFIFSDLVVLPVLRIQAKYYGWPLAFYIMGVFLVILVAASIVVHYGFSLAGLSPSSASARTIDPMSRFAIDHTFFLNAAFLIASAAAIVVWWRRRRDMVSTGGGWVEKTLFVVALASYAWLGGGLVAWLVI